MSDDAWANLDKVDQKIIEILNNNARASSKEIASELKKNQDMMFLIEQLEKELKD